MLNEAQIIKVKDEWNPLGDFEQNKMDPHQQALKQCYR